MIPDGVELSEEEDLNPEGTAVIELDVINRKFGHYNYRCGLFYYRHLSSTDED
jgi:hypothetical protein